MNPIAWSKTYGECYELIGAAIPIAYRYVGDDFELRLAVGDRWYPRLYIDAASADFLVTIQSRQAREATEGGVVKPVQVRGESFRYFVPNDVLENRVPITLDLYAPEGEQLAHLVLTYNLVKGYDLDFDSL